MTRCAFRPAWVATGLLSLVLGACSQSSTVNETTPQTKGGHALTIDKKPFGTAPSGKAADLYTLSNGTLQAKITNYGGIIVSLDVPDRSGKTVDVVLGYNTLDEYVKDSPYFGALVGRYANRIAKGKFTLNGKEYTLLVNNGPNALHGGKVGFDKVVWDAEPFKTANAVGLKLTYLSKDMEEGYPGNLKVTVRYSLTADNTLEIQYEATTDQPTVLNLSNHSYFNLAGEGSGDVLGQVMMINADRFLPVDDTLIPTGELRAVKGTPFDFTQPKLIGEGIKADDEQVKFGNGWDHCWVINQTKPGENTLVCRVTDPKSGRTMEMHTTEPAVQFYSGNFLDGKNVGKSGKAYNFRNAFCLEAEHYPDTPNHHKFPTTTLKPGQTYRQTTTYKFSAK